MSELNFEVFVKFEELIGDGHFLGHHCFFALTALGIRIVVLEHH